jgi:hypothetical protein
MPDTESTDKGISLKLDRDDGAPKLSSEYQRFITDAEPMERVYLFTLCGYRVKFESVTDETANALGVKKDAMFKTYFKMKSAAIMNDAGAEYLYSSYSPLLSQLSSTSSMTTDELIRIWKGALHSTNEELLNTVNDGNPYDYDFYRHRAVMRFLTQQYVIGMKCRDGFTLDKLASSFMTITRNLAGVPEMSGLAAPKSESALDKIVNAAKKVI